jgi:endo-1,4-beta-xylanase
MPAVAANIRRFADLGLEIHLTEMDIAIKVPVTDELRLEQAAEYEKVLRPVLEIPAVKALLFWGFTDKHSWIPGFTKGAYDESLPFDRDYRPKPAYEAVMKVLRRSP